MTIIFMIIDTQDMPALRILAFPVFTGCPYFFHSFSFNERLTYGASETSEHKSMRELNP